MDAVCAGRLLLQHGGAALLSSRCADGRLPLECATSQEMRHLLEHPPTAHLATPTKRKYASLTAELQVRLCMEKLLVWI